MTNSSYYWEHGANPFERTSSATAPATDSILKFDGTKFVNVSAATFLAGLTHSVTDSIFTIVDNSDATKKIAFQASGITTATTRTLTAPDASGTLTLNAATQTLQNKTLDNTNAIAAKDTTFTIEDDGDATKKIAFQASGITTATTRTLTVPDASGTLTLNAATQTLQNKTIDNTNTVAAKDSTFTIEDNGDSTKKLAFQLSGVTTSTTRTLTVPDKSATIETKLSANVTLTSAEILALNATPISVLAAPGAGFVNIIRRIYATKAAGTAYAGIAAGEDIAFKYTDASGATAATLEMTGFADSTGATANFAVPASVIPVENAAIVAHMLTGEITTGDSDFKLIIEYDTFAVPAF